MKKFVLTMATAALAAVTLTASGCGATGKNYAALASNWYYDSAFSGIQPSFTDEGSAEKLVYKVTQTSEGANARYTVKYDEGTYTTEFYAKKITAGDIDKLIFEESWRDGYKSALGTGGYMYLYYFSTALDIPTVTYTMRASGESKSISGGAAENVVTESYFMAVDDFLAPVYTKRTVKSATPVEWQPTVPDECFASIDRTYENCYPADGTQVKTRITGTINGNDASAESGEVFNTNNSVFDSAYLPVVARAMKNLTSGSLNVTLYTAGDKAKDFGLTSAGYEFGEAEQATIDAVLAQNGLFLPGKATAEDGTEYDKKTGGLTVSVRYAGGDFSGVSQNYVFAAAEDGKNRAHTVMVKYSRPLDFNLGRLEYVLSSIENFPNK